MPTCLTAICIIGYSGRVNRYRQFLLAFELSARGVWVECCAFTI